MATERRLWLPHVLRLSLFSRAQLAVDPTDTLKLYGVDPEITQEMPAQRQKMSMGSFGAGKIQAMCALDRVDLIWQVPVQPEMVWLGELPEAFAMLATPARTLIEAHSWSRVALGVQAGTLVDSHVDGYEAMAEKLPKLNLNGKECSDFHLQINRFIDVDFGNGQLRLNRLAKWQVGRYFFAPLRLDSGGAELNAGAMLNMYIANTELDINTSDELKRDISGREAVDILTASAEYARQMIENGDP